MNKRSRSSSRDVSSLLREPLGEAKPTQKRIRQLDKEVRSIRDEIARLEVTIAAAPVEMCSRRLATRNTLPALRSGSSVPRLSSKLPKVQVRARQKERFGKTVELFFVATLLAGALGWLNQWFHWW